MPEKIKRIMVKSSGTLGPQVKDGNLWLDKEFLLMALTAVAPEVSFGESRHSEGSSRNAEDLQLLFKKQIGIRGSGSRPQVTTF